MEKNRRRKETNNSVGREKKTVGKKLEGMRKGEDEGK